MKSTKLWIADPTKAYAKAFMEYVNLKKGNLFQVRICTEREQLGSILSKEEMELLLLDASWYPGLAEKLQDKCVILLSEGALVDTGIQRPAVYKYQSAETILREVMYYYSEQDITGNYIGSMHRDNRIVGVYSPIGGIGKTVFALTLAQLLAENQGVLYLNLEECSGMAEYFGSGHWNLSDLIYFLRQSKKGQFLYRMNSMLQKLDRLDYIPACESYADFRQITVEEWIQLLQLIRMQGSYDFIVLDLGNAVGHEPDLLSVCDGIYVPVKQDMISRAKVNQWELYLQVLDRLDILEKLQKLELPEHMGVLTDAQELSMLPKGELGEFIRRLVKE